MQENKDNRIKEKSIHWIYFEYLLYTKSNRVAEAAKLNNTESWYLLWYMGINSNQSEMYWALN